MGRTQAHSRTKWMRSMTPIEELRQRRRLSLSALARAAKIPVERVAAIREGEPPSRQEAKAISEALGVPTYALRIRGVEVQPLPSDFRTQGNEIAAVGRVGLSAMYRMQSAIQFFNLIKKDFKETKVFAPLKDAHHALEKWRLEGVIKEAISRLSYDFDRVLADFDPYALFWSLRERIESQGIYVICEELRTETFRGFCLYDSKSPLIFLNISKQPYRQRSFTLVHEYIHLLLGKGGVIDPFNYRVQLERFCNKVAAGTLMPSNKFAKLAKGSGHSDPVSLVNWLMGKVPLSGLALAIRTEEVTERRDIVSSWLAATVGEKPRADRGEGGEFDLTDEELIQATSFEEEPDAEEDQFQPRHSRASFQVARLGFGALSLANLAVETNLVSRFDVFEYLRVRPSVFDKAVQSSMRKRSEIPKNAKRSV